MRYLFYTVMIFLLLSCSKSIDIEYLKKVEEIVKPLDPIKVTDEDSLVGVWQGTMECPTCCQKKYGYAFTITKQNNNKLEGKVKIFQVPNKQFYVIFKLDITYNSKNRIVTLKTEGSDYILEETAKGGCGEYCLYNTYVLKFSSDRDRLDGEWTESSNCDVNENKDPIRLKKL